METKMKTITINAEGKVLGRLASEIAVILMGKNTPAFERHKITGSKVVVENASKLKIDPRKLEEMEYAKYSGYPGGLRYESLGQVIEKKGAGEAIRRAVYGMIPNNKLRAEIIKNLTITE